MDSFIRWVGGKRLLRKQILEQFPESEQYGRYVEVFGGAGWILFSKEKHAAYEVLNDINSDLINLYRCTKYHHEELQRELDGIFSSREMFFDFKEQLQMRGLTDIQRAARYFYLIKISYGADLKSFGMQGRRTKASIDFLKEAQRRLDRVVIENRDFESILKTYDRENTLFYLDPPYVEAERYYKNQFLLEDHERLKEKLDNIDGKFLLSYNDHPIVRDLYKEYTIISINRHHNMLTAAGGGRYAEVLIKNY